ncbi:hypothetical protein QTP88_024455 [Uroleucon formosanum]
MDVRPIYYNKLGTQLPHDIAKQLSTVYDINGNVIPFHNTVPEDQIVHVSGKRNLSSSSISPRPADKKSKPFVPRTVSRFFKATMIQVNMLFSPLVIILQHVRLSLNPISIKMQPVLNQST